MKYIGAILGVLIVSVGPVVCWLIWVWVAKKIYKYITGDKNV